MSQSHEPWPPHNPVSALRPQNNHPGRHAAYAPRKTYKTSMILVVVLGMLAMGILVLVINAPASNAVPSTPTQPTWKTYTIPTPISETPGSVQTSSTTPKPAPVASRKASSTAKVTPKTTQAPKTTTTAKPNLRAERFETCKAATCTTKTQADVTATYKPMPCPDGYRRVVDGSGTHCFEQAKSE